MKKRIKGWAVTTGSVVIKAIPENIPFPLMMQGETLIPCVIEYDDGKKSPKTRGAKK